MDPITTAAITSFVTTVATNSSKAPMESLDNLWYMTFGHKIEYFADIKRAKNELNLAQYKESIAKKISEIPEENLKEPQMSIVGPALEASKYYIEEKELREMFARVIAASMDASKSDYIHHSFVEIIKQLSPRDAKNIIDFKTINHSPIVSYAARRNTGESYELLKPLVFSLINSFVIDERDFPSISNLIRLGLLTYTFERYLIESTYYSFYRDNPLFHQINNSINKDENNLEVTDGIISITPLGEEFIKVCL